MDKYEYKVRAEEIKTLIAKGEFAEAVKIADTIDWHRVKSVMMLCTISDLYKINRRFQESKDILLMAYERHPGGRLIVYSLCELSIKMGEVVQAIEYYKEFVQIAPKDTGRYILQYKLYEAQDVSLEERIAVLEEFKKRDYREKWAYELAYLYHRIGLETKCVEECDEMILWFGEGRYVMKALELKQLHQPLSESQQEKYLLMKQGAEVPPEESPEEEPEDTEDSGDEEDAEKEKDTQLYGKAEDEPEESADMETDAGEDGEDESDSEDDVSETAEVFSSEEEEEFKVKTVDLGKYNTLNLQKELAESMREILGDDKKIQFQPERASMEPVIESVIAPLLQETGDIPQEELPEEKTESRLQIGELEFVDLEDEEPEEAAESLQYPEVPAVKETVGEDAGDSRKNRENSDRKGSRNTEDSSVQESIRNMQDIPNVENSNDVENVRENNLTIEEILQQETKRINLGDTKEILPGQKIIYPNTLPSRYAMVGQQSLPLQPEEKEQKPETVEVAVETPEILQAQPNLMKIHKPSGFEQMLSQEYDGQISLVVPNSEMVEKQITGQMNIADIMAEWERTKRENEEKRREDVRKRVQKHTGNMFSEFDEATKSGLLEQLEKAVVEAILKETAQGTGKGLTEEQLTDIVKGVSRKKEVSGETPEREDGSRSNIINFADVKGASESVGRIKSEDVQEAVPEEMPADKLPAGNLSAEELPAESAAGEAAEETTEDKAGKIPENTPEITPEITPKETVPIEVLAADEISGDGLSVKKLSAEALSIEAIRKLAGIEEETENGIDADSGNDEAAQEKAAQEGKTGSHAESKIRPFTEEEKELFGRFAHNHKSKEQIIHAIDEMSMDSYSGNVIITGEEEAGTLDLAKNLVRMMQLSDRNFSGKVAKISGETLNKKDVQATLLKLTDGALIIEHATDMSSGTATDLNKALAKENRGLFVVMEAKKDEMNIFLRKNRALMDNFNARIDIESLDDHSLVEYAKLYAEEQEYSIDELGILALHTRIADMQTSDHEVTVAEVKDLVDDAIYFADKKNPKHFFDILFGKRYDAEDMIILREKDFMHY